MDFSGSGEDFPTSDRDTAGKGCDPRDSRVSPVLLLLWETAEQHGVCGKDGQARY